MSSYYAIIPANVRYDREIPANAKLLYGEITALCNEKGFCWASNSYFAELYDVATETISRWIGKLQRAGYVKTHVSENEGNNRKIWITTPPIDENVKTYPQKDQEGLDKKVKHNNTENNTNNKREDEVEKPYKSEYFTKAWEEWILYRKERKMPKYAPRGLRQTFKNIVNLSGGNEVVAVKILEQSMANNWQGLFPLKNIGKVDVQKPQSVKLTYDEQAAQKARSYVPMSTE